MADIQKAESDSPDRCQAVTRNMQCQNKAAPGSTMCLCHGGNLAERSATAAGLKNYRLTKFNARLEQLGNSPDIKSLRDEVAILRMLLEERLNLCKENMDLIYQSGPISDLVIKIEKLVVSCHKLESAMGTLLDKQAIIRFGNELVSLLSSEIKDEDVLERLSSAIVNIISRTVDAQTQETIA